MTYLLTAIGLTPAGSSTVHIVVVVVQYIYIYIYIYIYRGHAVAQLVEALRYKPEGRGFDSRWCHWNFSFT